LLWSIHMTTGKVFNVQRFSVQDGLGVRTTVFFKGCNLSCIWCHNPESISFKNQIELYQERCIGCGTAPLHLDIDKDMLGSEDGIDALIALIHTHNHMGGTLINLNCLTKKMLLEAHEDPSKHPDLVVRVTGYSAFFASLSKTYRQQIVDRFLSR